MNTERLQILRDEIAKAPPEEFYYDTFFCTRTKHGGIQRIYTNLTVPEPHCGTVGCVAGWALMLFAPGEITHPQHKPGHALSASVQAQGLLDLDIDQRNFLFVNHVEHAKREDALRRLDHVIAGGFERNYDWTKESWFAEHFEDEGFLSDGSVDSWEADNDDWGVGVDDDE